MENEIWTTKVAFSFENKYFFEDRRIYSGDTAPTGAARNSQIQQATADNNPAQVLATLVRPFVIYTSCLLRSEVVFLELEPIHRVLNINSALNFG